jgi:hypothetical protein
MNTIAFGFKRLSPSELPFSGQQSAPHVHDQIWRRLFEAIVPFLRCGHPECIDEVLVPALRLLATTFLIGFCRGKSGGSARGNSRAESSRSISIRADHEYLAIPNYDDEEKTQNKQHSSFFGRNASGRIVSEASGRAASVRFGLSGRQASRRLQSVEQRRGRAACLRFSECVIFWRQLMACAGMSYMSPLEPELNEGDRCECVYEFCSLSYRSIFSPD